MPPTVRRLIAPTMRMEERKGDQGALSDTPEFELFQLGDADSSR